MKTRLFAVLIPVIATLAFAAPAFADSSASSEAVSENWAGYEATSTSSSGFEAVSGSWVQPTVSCTSGETSYSAYWVGLGGGDENSTALEQEGTQADCSSSGQVSYYAWYELVPSAPVKIDMTIHAGDKIWARTAVDGDKVTVTVDDKTTGQDYTKTLTMTDATPDTSTAEWVAEAPSECEGGATGNCQPLTLADFSKVSFSNAYARDSSGQVKSISGYTDEAIELSPSSASDFGYGGGYGGGFGNTESSATSTNSEGAAPGSLSSDGTSFTVTYGTQLSSASTGTGSTGVASSGSSSGDSGYGYGSSTSSDGYGYGSSTSGDGYGYGDYGYGYGDSGYGDSTSGYGDSGYGYSLYGGGSTGGYGYSYGYSPYEATGSYGYAETYYRANEVSAVYGD